MKKTILPIVIVCIAVLTLSGCAAVKNYRYFKNLEQVDLTNTNPLFDARIMPKDMLSISVLTTDPEAGRPFNLWSMASGNGNVYGGNGGMNSTMNYLVDNDGYIEFPVVGRMHVSGMTKTELQNYIKKKIAPYLAEKENPIVTVRMSSYHVTVIGEVGRPGVIPVTQERISLLEAITQSGDITPLGKKNQVYLIREDAQGNKTVKKLNLNDATVLNDPDFYLQQNDIVYVPAYNLKVNSTYLNVAGSFWFSITGLATSVVSLVYVFNK